MQKYWRQAGMSLVEVMLGGAMLAAVGLVGAELFKRQSSATKYAVARSELDIFHDKISKMIQDSRNCSVNFAASVGNSSVTASDLGAALYQCCPNAASNPTCKYTNADCMGGVGYAWGPNRKPFVTIGALVTPATPGGFLLQSMSVTDEAGGAVTFPPGQNGVVKGEIRMFYRKVNSAAATGVPDVVKKIPVAFQFRDNSKPTVGIRFTGCTDAEIGTKNTLQQELCKSIGSNLADYDPSIDKCVYKNTVPTHNCTTGVLTGIDSNGNAICNTGAGAFDENQIINSANGTNCNTNTNVTFAWDSATNTIRVICPP